MCGAKERERDRQRERGREKKRRRMKGWVFKVEKVGGRENMGWKGKVFEMLGKVERRERERERNTQRGEGILTAIVGEV